MEPGDGQAGRFSRIFGKARGSDRQPEPDTAAPLHALARLERLTERLTGTSLTPDALLDKATAVGAEMHLVVEGAIDAPSESRVTLEVREPGSSRPLAVIIAGRTARGGAWWFETLVLLKAVAHWIDQARSS